VENQLNLYKCDHYLASETQKNYFSLSTFMNIVGESVLLRQEIDEGYQKPVSKSDNSSHDRWK